jgi:hypothetical protein
MIGFAVQATAIAALALVALILLGRRPFTSARAEPRSPGWGGSNEAIPVEQSPTKLYRSPGPVRRLLAASTTTIIAVVLGMVIAIVMAFAAVYAVVTLTGLLDR